MSNRPPRSARIAKSRPAGPQPAEFSLFGAEGKVQEKEEQSVDEIVSKRMLQHLKQYFYESNGKSLKRRKKEKKNKSLKKK